MTVSVVGHAILLGALAFVGLLSQQTPPKAYIVNLVAGLQSPSLVPARDLKPQPTLPPSPQQSPPAPWEPARPAAKPPSPPALPPLPERKPSLPRLPPSRIVTSARELPPPVLPRFEEQKPPVPREAKGSEPSEAPRTPQASPPGPAVGSTTVSAQASDFPFTWYLMRIQAKVQERWAEQPRLSAPAQRPIIFVEIAHDGSIKPPRLEQTSGNFFYDQAALRAITEASPFPPLPQEWTRPTLRIQFGFEMAPSRG